MIWLNLTYDNTFIQMVGNPPKLQNKDPQNCKTQNMAIITKWKHILKSLKVMKTSDCTY
jgi:hypothetical protein